MIFRKLDPPKTSAVTEAKIWDPALPTKGGRGQQQQHGP
jgi:hypothetical protein